MAKNKDYKRILNGEIYFPDIEVFEEKLKTTRFKKDLRLLLLDTDDKVVELPFDEAGENDHNSLDNIQGGQPGQAYHLTADEYIKLKSLISIGLVTTIKVNPLFGEKAIPSDIVLTFSIVSNDDVITSADISNGIGDVLSSINLGNISIPILGLKTTQNYVLLVTYNRNGVIGNEVKTATYNAYAPQFAGVASVDDMTTYNEMIFYLIKYVQPSFAISKKSSPTAEYIWFVSNKSNAIIKDQNNFVQNQGVWNNGSTEFYRKEIDILLADGVTSQTVYLYRSRGVKTLTDFTYKIE